MYPFDSRLRWWLRPRPAHLIGALEHDPGLATGPHQAAIGVATMRLRRWMVVRVIMLAGLSMGAIASIAILVLRTVGGLADLVDALRIASRISTTLAGAFSLGFLVANRTLGQLEMDALMLLHLTQSQKSDDHE